MASHISSNRGVVYKRPGVVAVEDVAIPRFEVPLGNGEKRRCEHGVIVKCVATNICGSDQHMVRGRTTAQEGLVLGHEITGEVIARGQDVEVIQVGDLVSVPFNVACGRCRCCVEGKTGVCLNVNPGRPGGAYGYVDMGPWQGGQAQYVLIPYADFNCLKIPHKDKSMEKIRDLALLSDILPTGYHGVITSGATQGSTVYIAGAGPVGLAAAAAAQLIGCAAVIVGDMNQQRLAQARSFGCYTVDLTSQNTLVEQIDKILGEPVVDCAVDCVGFEARSHTNAKEVPAQVLNDVMNVTRVGGGIGIPGLYVTEDPGAVDTSAKFGSLSIRLGTGWSKSLSFVTGQCPVMKYNRRLMNAILFDKIQIAKAVNASVISLDEAPAAYQDFDKGAAKKFIIDPHGSIPRNNSRL